MWRKSLLFLVLMGTTLVMLSGLLSSCAFYTCEQRQQNAKTYLDAVYPATLACSMDRDCAQVDITSGCAGACPVPVAGGYKTKMELAVAEVNEKWCRDYRYDGCSYSTPSCKVQLPRCKEGKCVLEDNNP